MAKFEDRENRRRSSIVGSIVDRAPAAGSGRGRPREDRETKKRISLSVLPSLYEDMQKIAYVERRSVSDVIGDLMGQFRAEHEKELAEYENIKKSEKKGRSNC